MAKVLPILRYAVLGFGLCGLFLAGQRLGGPTMKHFSGAWLNRTVEKSVRLFTLHRVRQVQEQSLRQYRAEFTLPEIRRRVGSSSVDIMAHRQGVLLLNGLNWRPRPVFQSYLTYTASLLESNSRFFASDDAPDYVIFRLQTVDGRFKTMDDSLALVELFRRYDPLIVERSYILFKRHGRWKGSEGFSPEGPPTFERTIILGEELVLPQMGDIPLWLSIDIRYSLIGRLRTLFYRGPSVTLIVKDERGGHKPYAIVPVMCRTGFIINPLLRNQRELIGWLAGDKVGRAAVLRVDVQRGGHSYFRPKMTVRLQPVAGIRPRVAESTKQQLRASLDPAGGESPNLTGAAPEAQAGSIQGEGQGKPVEFP